MDQLFRLAASIAGGVLDLRTDLGNRLAFPCHFARREMPFRMARHTAGFEVRVLMANRAAHRWKTVPVRTARDRRLMQPAQIALPRTIAGRMAVGAARMGQHLA